jgi:hypothetical protein
LSFFQAGKRAAARQQFGFERASASRSGAIVEVTGAGVGLAWTPARSMRVRQAKLMYCLPRLALIMIMQRQNLLQDDKHKFRWHLRGQLPAYHAPRAGIAPGGQIAPAPTD